MNEKELIENQKQVAELMKTIAKNPEEAVKKLLELQKRADEDSKLDSLEYYAGTAAIQEALGDSYMNMKNVPEAEKAYQESVRRATKLYEADKEKYDYRLGVSYYKLGAFYRTIIGCNVLSPKAKTLNEQQKKIFDLSEKCYKNALGCTMDKAKAGNSRCVEFHATCLQELMVLQSSVGNFETAVLLGKDSVRLSKALYEKIDDKGSAFRLANRMNGLAGVYLATKQPQLAMENLEDAVFVLEEHEEEDPKFLGTVLGKYYIALGNCYCYVEEEKENAEDAYKKGLNRLIKLNDQSNNRLVDDLIQSYVLVGDYYAREGRETDAKAHYTWAMKLSTDMGKVTKNPKYDAMIKHLQGKI